MNKRELFLNELESLLGRYFGKEWHYDFDDDKPITIDVPIQADDKLDTVSYRQNMPMQRVSHEIMHCHNCSCQDPRLTDVEFQSIIDSVTEEGYEVQATDLANEWAYSSYYITDRDEAIENGYLTIYCKECNKDLRYDCQDYDVPICDSCLEKGVLYA
jgi:hypothetical protein